MNNRIAKARLKQKAVYWGSPVPNGYGGINYASPVEINCRWVDKQERFVGMNNIEHVSKAVVVVDTNVVLGGRLALMELADLNSSQLPEDEVTYEIKGILKSPDYKGTIFMRKAMVL